MDRPAPRARFSGLSAPIRRYVPLRPVRAPSRRTLGHPSGFDQTGLRAARPRNGAHERLVLQHMVASGRAPAQRRREVEFVIFASRLRAVRPRGGADPGIEVAIRDPSGRTPAQRNG